jgi:hypothetical protein
MRFYNSNWIVRPRLLDRSRAVSITERITEAVEAIGHRADTEFVAYASMVRYRTIRKAGYKRGVIRECFPPASLDIYN